MPLVPVDGSTRDMALFFAGRRPPDPTSDAWPVRARGKAVRLPSGSPGSAELEDVLVRRRSVRTFSAAAVMGDQVSLLLRAGYRAERRHWPPAVHGDAGIVVVLAAVNVSGLTPGLYLADRDEDSLTSLSTERRPLSELRRGVADAAALLLVCADVNHSCLHGGASGYAALLVRAGALGHFAWLSAISVGLVGFISGASHPAVTSSLRRTHPHLRHLYTVAIGNDKGG